MDEKIKVMPCACFSHDDQGGRLRIEMEMPGVNKEDISLEMRRDTFCVSAPKGKDTEYTGCFKLSHEVVPEETEARYENGFLKIFAPIKDWDHRVNVTVR